MKQSIAVLLAALILFTGCAMAETEASRLVDGSPECAMIGQPYSVIEDAYGPISAVYIEADGNPLMLFEKTAVGFYFAGMKIPAAWSAFVSSGVIPTSVAVRGISPNEPCTGISGRLKDLGINDVQTMSEHLELLTPVYSEKLDKDVYTLEIQERGLVISALSDKDSHSITKETVVRVQQKGTPAQTIPPAADLTPLPTAAPDVVQVVTPSPTPDYETPYRKAKAYMEKGNYVEALTILKELNGYADSGKLIITCQNEIVYQNAMDQYKSRNFEEAEILFGSLGNYRDAELYMLRARILPSKKGDRIRFGRYEQDDKTSTPEEIEWIVLARTGNKRLLISRYILTTLPFDKNHKVADDRENIAEAGRVPATWEKSSLRKWLNGTFLNTAFDNVEKSVIMTTRVSNEGNEGFNIKGGSVTKDRIFLLSISEATKYFTKDANRKATKTNYAKNIYSAGKRYSWWWLRSPGMHYDFAAIVMSSGGYTEASGDWQGRGANNAGGVRPVMWIDLS